MATRNTGKIFYPRGLLGLGCRPSSNQKQIGICSQDWNRISSHIIDYKDFEEDEEISTEIIVDDDWDEWEEEFTEPLVDDGKYEGEAVLKEAREWTKNIKAIVIINVALGALLAVVVGYFISVAINNEQQNNNTTGEIYRYE